MSIPESETDYCIGLRAQLAAANARADAAQLDAESWARKAAHADHAAEESERENSDYREMHRATVAERAENGSNPLSVQQRIRRAEKAARDKALVEAAEKCGEYANGLIYDNGSHWMRHGLPAAILALRDKPAPAVTVQEAASYYIDCEFDGHGGPLISIAMVPQNGDSLYVTVDNAASDPWVIENVIPILGQHNADLHFHVEPDEVGNFIRRFIPANEMPVIIADSPVDIGRFCQALSTGGDGGWASTDFSSMNFKVINVDCYPTKLANAVQHNAWWDAMALRAIAGGGDE